MPGKNTPTVRAFFSVDMAGSTKLKNDWNLQRTINKFKLARELVGRISIEHKLELPNPDQTAIELTGIRAEDSDWAKVVQEFYDSFHNFFVQTLKDVFPQAVCPNAFDKPWKAVGDELIYSIELKGRKELHLASIAFLAALRQIDQAMKCKGKGLRAKGAAWIAGFPVRNRVIELPAKSGSDFLGPDMDTGFRIGKCTRPGMLVVSVELAELLGEGQGSFSPMKGMIVGWETLKGVWNDHPYPVIWVDFPSDHPMAFKHPAVDFDPWERDACRWSDKWQSHNRLSIPESIGLLRHLRTTLSESLGLVDPYISGDPDVLDEVHPVHKEIVRLLAQLDVQSLAADRQGTDDISGNSAPEDRNKLNADINAVNELGSHVIDSDSASP